MLNLTAAELGIGGSLAGCQCSRQSQALAESKSHWQARRPGWHTANGPLLLQGVLVEWFA